MVNRIRGAQYVDIIVAEKNDKVSTIYLGEEMWLYDTQYKIYFWTMNTLLLCVQIYLVFTARWIKAFNCWNQKDYEEEQKYYDDDNLVDDDESVSRSNNINDDHYERYSEKTK